MLGDAVIFAIQNLLVDVVAKVAEYTFDYLPCSAFVVIYDSFYILKNKYLRLAFFDDSGKFIE